MTSDGLALRVDLAVIGDNRQVAQIAGVVGGVVEVPERLLPRGRGFVAGQLELLVLRRFGEPGAGRRRGEQSAIVRREVPDRCAAHAEAAHQNAILVDGILALHGVERFEEVHLPGELAGVAVAAVEVEHDGIARPKFAGIALAVAEKRRSG